MRILKDLKLISCDVSCSLRVNSFEPLSQNRSIFHFTRKISWFCYAFVALKTNTVFLLPLPHDAVSVYYYGKHVTRTVWPRSVPPGALFLPPYRFRQFIVFHPHHKLITSKPVNWLDLGFVPRLFESDLLVN